MRERARAHEKKKGHPENTNLRFFRASGFPYSIFFPSFLELLGDCGSWDVDTNRPVIVVDS
jgi:hypothetical protein